MRGYLPKLLMIGLLFSNSLWARGVGDIDPDEADKLVTRIKSKNSSTFAFGPAFFRQLDSSDMAYRFQGGRRFDVHPHFSVNALGGFAFNGQALMIDSTLGLDVYATNTDIAPFGGVGLGFGVTSKNWNERLIAGFDLLARAGVVFFRTSTTQLEIAFQYGSFLTGTSGPLPQSFGGVLGVAW